MSYLSAQGPTEKHGGRKAHISAYSSSCAKAVMVSPPLEVVPDRLGNKMEDRW